MFQKPKPRLLLIGLILLGVGVAALTWFLGAKPQLAAYEKAKTETAQERGLNDIEQITVEKLRIQNENIADFKAELADYRKGIPETHEQSELLRQFTKAATKADVTLVNVTSSEILSYLAPPWQQPAPDTGNGRLVGLTLDLEAEGSLKNLEKFVSEIQTIDRYITVNSVSFTPDGRKGKVQIAGTGWVLISAEAAAASSATGTAPEPEETAGAEETTDAEAETATEAEAVK